MKFILFGFSVGILCSVLGYSFGYVEEVFKWKNVEFENLPVPEDTYVGPYRYYIPENNDIGSIGYHPASGLMILVLLRVRPGVPTSLAAFCVNENPPGSSPKVWGFPSYQINALEAGDFVRATEEELGGNVWNKPGSSYNYFSNSQLPSYGEPLSLTIQPPKAVQRIVSVFQITIDERCNRVFFMDNGQVQFYRNATYAVQKSALWVMELPSNGCETRSFPIIRRSELPVRIAEKGSYGFTHIALDYKNVISCESLHLYIANTLFNYLLVYDYQNDDFWAFDHPTFHPVVAESSFIYDGFLDYSMKMGLFSISLGYQDENGDRTAYYTPIAGTAQYSVSTKVLKDKRKTSLIYNPDDFKITGYLGCKHQPLKTAIDYTYRVIFYADAQTNQIRCWNYNTPLNPDNIGVIFEPTKFIFSTQIFIDSRGYLWLLSSPLPVTYSSDFPLNLHEVNSIIYRVKVSDAVRGTICDDGDQNRPVTI
ncbi:L-dopachrome tautomerase yellow-f2-like [Lutzomyia longipalpis]|uniref:L-dopachrome tautomerase yellow-f2-like n=1 Tax=Lutzomyia longipalpis TaxID=7200 RepID=UPI0024845E12|nr:L-dopachrome tautomerase yellow-f2-like [Lutzomyia longipalpis]